MARLLAAAGLFDAALAIVPRDNESEDGLAVKAEIGIRMREAGEMARPRAILAELCEKESSGIRDRVPIRSNIARLQAVLGTEREKLMLTLASCEEALRQSERQDNFHQWMEIAKLYMPVDALIAQRILQREKERFFAEYILHGNTPDLFRSTFITLFDTALAFDLYDEAQDILNRYRKFREEKLSHESREELRRVSEMEYRLWQRMIDARCGNKRPPMMVLEEVCYDLAAMQNIAFVEPFEFDSSLSASKVVKAVYGRLSTSDSSRNQIIMIVWTLLSYFDGTSPDESRVLAKEVIEEAIDRDADKDSEFALNAIQLLTSDIGRGLYEDCLERRTAVVRAFKRYLLDKYSSMTRSSAAARAPGMTGRIKGVLSLFSRKRGQDIGKNLNNLFSRLDREADENRRIYEGLRTDADRTSFKNVLEERNGAIRIFVQEILPYLDAQVPGRCPYPAVYAVTAGKEFAALHQLSINLRIYPVFLPVVIRLLFAPFIADASARDECYEKHLKILAGINNVEIPLFKSATYLSKQEETRNVAVFMQRVFDADVATPAGLDQLIAVIENMERCHFTCPQIWGNHLALTCLFKIIAGSPKVCAAAAELFRQPGAFDQHMPIEEFLKKIGVEIGDFFSRIYNGMKVTSISFADNGMVESNFADIAEYFLDAGIDFKPLELPEPPPAYEDVDMDKAPTLDSIAEVIAGCEFVRAQGRTLIYRRRESGVLLAIKLLRENANLGLLYQESRYMDYIDKYREIMGLKGRYPRAVLVRGNRMARAASLPDEAIKALDEQKAGDGTKIRCDRRDGKYAFTVYETESEDWFTYLNDARIDERRFQEALYRNIHDLFMLARYGIVHTAIAALFHNLPANRRYAWNVDILSRPGLGAGRLHDWLGAVTYPNMRLSGPADFEELRTLEEVTRPDNPVSSHLFMIQNDRRQNIRNYYLQSYLGEYLLTASLIAGARYRIRGELNWKDPKRLLQLMRGCFSAAQGDFSEGDRDFMGYILVCVDWTMLARQMALFMSKDYIEFVKPELGPARKLPAGIFSPNTQVGVGNYRNETWDDEIGWTGLLNEDVSDHKPALGPVNGPNPLQELIRALYIAATAYVDFLARPVDSGNSGKPGIDTDIPPAGSIYSVFSYLCGHDITTTERAISGEELARRAGEEHPARGEALSPESIKDDLRDLLLHLQLIKKAPGGETGKNARYYVPEAVKKKAGEFLPILEQFRGKKLRPRAYHLKQIYDKSIKPILDAPVVEAVKSEKIGPSPLTLESFMETIKRMIEYEVSRPEPMKDVFDTHQLVKVALWNIAVSPRREKIAAELKSMTERYLEDTGFKKVNSYIYTAFRNFAREKEYRNGHRLFEDPEGGLPWAEAEKEADPGIQKIVIALNKLPFLYTSSWSHSCLPSDHRYFDIGKYPGLSSPNWIDDIFHGTQTGIDGMRAYIGYGEAAGFISLRVDENSPLYQEFTRLINTIDGVRIVDFLRKPYGLEKLIFIEVPKNLLQIDKEQEVETYLKDKWARVFKAVCSMVTAVEGKPPEPNPGTDSMYSKESGGVGEEVRRRVIEGLISQDPGCAESPQKLLSAIRAKRPDILDMPQSDEAWLAELAEALKERAGMISDISSTIPLSEESLQTILPKDALYEVVTGTLEKRRGLIARMLLSNYRAGREIAEEIIQAKPNKAVVLTLELREEVREIITKKSPDSLSDLDRILIYAYTHLRRFSRRAFGANIVGFLIGEQLTGLEEAGAFAQKALSVFIPAPRAAPGFTNPLSEAHWR
ncbi:MAG: hypothetical protein Q8N91_00365, partial [Candidatus Omnitrophota bacterium]|nr:hypothetical protein [Candidatus Omnitrophota bacterium]